MSNARAALDFAFRVVPGVRRDGWEVVETSKWPYRLSGDPAELTVTTRSEAGEAFQGNDWFSLGFQAEIGGRAVDVAPLVAAFLEQIREDWDEVPDAETLTQNLADRPVYLDRGKAGYVALDLGPLAPLLHLFLTHHAELGALHPSDAGAARLAQEALAGSDIRVADKTGILPPARSLQALAETAAFQPPGGLRAQLRDFHACGAACCRPACVEKSALAVTISLSRSSVSGGPTRATCGEAKTMESAVRRQSPERAASGAAMRPAMCSSSAASCRSGR